MTLLSSDASMGYSSPGISPLARFQAELKRVGSATARVPD
jgi:hypothetical protein